MSAQRTKRFGAVIVFKPGVSEAIARAALNEILAVKLPPGYSGDTYPVDLGRSSSEAEPFIEEHGFPVFYVP